MTETAGYSGTPLIKKLGLRPGMSARLINPPERYWTLLGGEPNDLELQLLEEGEEGEADFTHLFARTESALASGFGTARDGTALDGMIWASWPKKSSGVESEISRSEVMVAGKSEGLVDVKVCAVDETWSGLKFVVPVENRD